LGGHIVLIRRILVSFRAAHTYLEKASGTCRWVVDRRWILDSRGEEAVFGVAVSSRFLEDSVTGNNDDGNDGSPMVCNPRSPDADML
jgi:hypothetical protein